MLSATTRALILALVASGAPLSRAEESTVSEGPPPKNPALEKPDLETSIREAAQWLIDNQRDNGAWGSHHSPRPIEVLCDVPGSHQTFRISTTALGIMALNDVPFQTDAIRSAIGRAIDSILEDFDVKRPSGLEHYTVWAFGYTLHAFGEHLLAHPDDPRAEAMREVCRHYVKKLGVYQCLDGGWGYLSLDEVPTYRPSFTSMSFTTATILIGLDRVAKAGIDVPDAMIRKAVKAVQRCRTPTGSYTYGQLWNGNPGGGINQIKGAACRTPMCQYGVELFGETIEEKDHRRAIDDLTIKHTRFQILSLRRPIPHESHYQISGYFYLYGYGYAAYVLEDLPTADQAKYWPPLVDAVQVCRQPDGSYWDYPLYSYHKPYGTAFALIALTRAYKAQSLETRAVVEKTAEH